MSLAPGRHATWAVGVAFVALALAGCTSGGGDGDVLQAARDAAASGDLVLYLNLTIDGQTYRFSSSDPTATPNLSPPAAPPPLHVNATLEARGLPDGSGADLQWTLDWGDSGGTAGGAGNSSAGGANATASGGSIPLRPTGLNGTGADLPARVSHTFTEAGRHRIQAALAVAQEKVSGLQVPVTVGGNATPEIPPGTELGREPFSEEGALPMGLPGCGSEGVDLPWAFNASVNGTPAEVSRIALTLATSGMARETGLQVLDGNGTVVAEADGSSEAGQVLDAAGPFPPGAYTVRVLGCATVSGSYAVDGEATYVAAATATP